MRFLFFVAVLLSTPNFVHAAATRAITADTISNTSGGSVLTIPAVGASFISDSAAQTLTGKTISGSANTLSAIPTSALTGVLGVANGGTGAASLASGSLLIGAGTGSVTGLAPGTTGQVLTSNGTAWVSQAVPTSTPLVSGSQASPISVTAAGGVVFSGSNYYNVSFIAGSGGAVTVSASPQIAAGTVVGQQLILRGTSATNTLTLADGTGLSLNGGWVGSNNSALTLVWDGALWAEISRR